MLCFNNTFTMLNNLTNHQSTIRTLDMVNYFKEVITVDNAKSIYNNTITLLREDSLEQLDEVNIVFPILFLKLILLGVYIIICSIIINKFVTKNVWIKIITKSIGQTICVFGIIMILVIKMLCFGLHYYFTYYHLNNRNCYT